MNIYYILSILLFSVYQCGYFVREAKNKGVAYTVYAVITMFISTGICVYLTAMSILKLGIYAPLWFEDFLLIDFSVMAALTFIWMTRKTPLRRLYFGILAAGLSTLLAVFATEMALRAFYVEYLSENRIGRRYERVDSIDVDVILHGSIPGAKKLEQLHEEKVSLEERFQLRDLHIVPSQEKKKDEIRVAWLGDSMIEQAQVPPEQRFINLLEEDTGYPQYVLAVGGTSVDVAKIVVNRFFDVIKPDIVILGFNPLNDFREFGRQYSACGFAPLFSRHDNEWKYDCAENPGLLFETIFIQPQNAFFHFAAYSTVFGNALMDARRKTYIRIAKRFYYKPNPYGLPPLFAPSDIEKVGEAVCSMVNEIEKDVTDRGALFAVTMLPYLRGDKRITHSLQDNFYPPDSIRDSFLECMKGSDTIFFNLIDEFDEAILDITKEDTIFLLDRHFDKRGNRMAADLLAPFVTQLIETTFQGDSPVTLPAAKTP